MILTAKQSILKSLMEDTRWDVVEELKEEFVAKWGEESGVGFDEFQTLKLTFTKEGKKGGLNSFFRYLEDQASGGSE